MRTQQDSAEAREPWRSTYHVPTGRDGEDLRDVVRSQTARISRLEQIIRLAPVGIGIVDLDGKAPLANDHLRELLGYTPEEFADMPFSEYSHPDEIAENLRLFGLLTSGGIDRFALEKRLRSKDGRLVWVALTVSLVRDDADQPAYAIAMVQDISARKRLEEELRDAEKHYRLLVQRVPAVVYTAEAGAGGRWLYVSPQIEQLLGFTPEEWTASPGLWFERMVEADRAAVIDGEDHVQVTSAEPLLSTTYRLRHRDERIVWVRDAAVARRGRGGAVVLNGVLVDVTQEKALEEALARQAIHDPLTGLVNRGHFRERVDEALRESHVGGPAVALLFIDLDGFKAINDTLGHGAGDVVLSQAARRLLDAADPACVVARLGGDEFAVLVTGAEADALRALAAGLLDALVEPASAGTRVVRVGASIGGALAGPADTTDTLLHRADQAMYRAKGEGGGRFLLEDRRPDEV
ncbi:MAG TPA: diguanylate cyclase [Actinotalea sp.]